MVGGLESAADLVVALFTIGRTDIFCTRHVREHHRLAVESAAGNGRQQQNDRSGGKRQIPAAPATRQQRVDDCKFFHADLGWLFISRIFGKCAVTVACRSRVYFLVDQIFSRGQQVEGKNPIVRAEAAVVDDEV